MSSNLSKCFRFTLLVAQKIERIWFVLIIHIAIINFKAYPLVTEWSKQTVRYCFISVKRNWQLWPICRTIWVKVRVVLDDFTTGVFLYLTNIIKNDNEYTNPKVVNSFTMLAIFLLIDSIDSQMANTLFCLHWLEKHFDFTPNTHLGLRCFCNTHFHLNSTDIYQHLCISDKNLLDSSSSGERFHFTK